MSELIGNFSIVSRNFLRETDGTGRFRAAAGQGARDAIEELADTMADLVRASMSAQTRRRTGDLEDSVHTAIVSTQESDVVADSDHAAPLDRGAVAHAIPNAFGLGIVVWHPGNKPYHFFATAETAMKRLGPEIVARNMP